MSNQDFKGIQNLLQAASPKNKKAAAAVNAATRKWQAAANNWTKKTTSNSKTRATVNVNANAKANTTEISYNELYNEEDTRQDLIKILDFDFIKTFRDVKIPNASEFNTAIKSFISGTQLKSDEKNEEEKYEKTVFGNTEEYNQDIADENYAFKEMFKLTIITLFGTSITECEKELKAKPDSAKQKQLEGLKVIYAKLTDKIELPKKVNNSMTEEQKKNENEEKRFIVVPKRFNPDPVSFTQAVSLGMMRGELGTTLENKMMGGVNGIVPLTNSLATPQTTFLHIPPTGMLPSGTTSSVGYIDPSLYVNRGVIPPYVRRPFGTAVEHQVFNPTHSTQGAYKFNAFKEVTPLSLNRLSNSNQ
jgi:hypothetical protein